MKKIFKSVIIVLIFIFSFAITNINTVFADTGPKRSISININGDTDGYYMTLLSKNDNLGPWSTNRSPNDEIDLKFSSYHDKDNYYYLYYYDKIEDKYFTWGYYPPYTFKILIYDSINDKFINNDNIYEAYAFESNYILDINGLILNKNIQIGFQLLNFFLRLIICLIIEIIIALIFKINKQRLIIITIANVITQILLNLGLSIFIYFNGLSIFIIIPLYLVFEIAVTLIELFLYIMFIPKIEEKYNLYNINKSKIIAYALTSNLTSFVLGYIILIFVPNIH